MNVNISKTEYFGLLQFVFCASAFINSYELDSMSPEKLLTLNMLMQRILSIAGDFDLADMVEYDEEWKEYTFSQGFLDESEILDILEEFHHTSLFEDLIEALSLRDLAHMQISSFDPPFDMPEEELFDLVLSVRERYANEFSKYGLKRLEIPE